MLRIAQIAPLMESVPPELYGGTERIVSYLTEELVRQGHDVTLFASGDSNTAARLVRCSAAALRLNPEIRDPLPYHVVMLEEVRRRADAFDVLHFHIDLLHAPMVHEFADRTVTTLHGRLDLPDLKPFYRAFDELAVISISHDQRRPIASANWVGNVYHGLPRDVLAFRAPRKGGYLAFTGRITPDKGPDRAIEIATRSGLPLKIAAKIDKVDQEYWDSVIEPMVHSHPNVEFIGEVNEEEKADFLGNARGLLFPICWPEPFGLVMIEAMACGTPVIAFKCGSVPEVIDDGVTGLIVETVDQAVEAVTRLEFFDRKSVRAAFERRFTVERMAAEYVDVYRSLPGVRESRKPTVAPRALDGEAVTGP
ncbi:MAG TPA: glycosyltransferase family 4 protein [Dongiaceae bacterium]|jgi:glycosyltransferase involved in cell wall biosynthesis